MTPFLALFSFYNGMSSGNEPPPVVIDERYGPALSPKQRMKWFSPGEIQRKKAEQVRRQRIELGIEEDEDLATQEKLVMRAKERVANEMKRLQKEKAEREELEFIMKLLNED